MGRGVVFLRLLLVYNAIFSLHGLRVARFLSTAPTFAKNSLVYLLPLSHSSSTLPIRRTDVLLECASGQIHRGSNSHDEVPAPPAERSIKKKKRAIDKLDKSDIAGLPPVSEFKRLVSALSVDSDSTALAHTEAAEQLIKEALQRNSANAVGTRSRGRPRKAAGGALEGGTRAKSPASKASAALPVDPEGVAMSQLGDGEEDSYMDDETLDLMLSALAGEGGLEEEESLLAGGAGLELDADMEALLRELGDVEGEGGGVGGDASPLGAGRGRRRGRRARKVADAGAEGGERSGAGADLLLGAGDAFSLAGLQEEEGEEAEDPLLVDEEGVEDGEGVDAEDGLDGVSVPSHSLGELDEDEEVDEAEGAEEGRSVMRRRGRGRGRATPDLDGAVGEAALRPAASVGERSYSQAEREWLPAVYEGGRPRQSSSGGDRGLRLQGEVFRGESNGMLLPPADLHRTAEEGADGEIDALLSAGDIFADVVEHHLHGHDEPAPHRLLVVSVVTNSSGNSTALECVQRIYDHLREGTGHDPRIAYQTLCLAEDEHQPFAELENSVQMWVEGYNTYHLVDGAAMKEAWGGIVPHILLSPRNLQALLDQVRRALEEDDMGGALLTPRLRRLRFRGGAQEMTTGFNTEHLESEFSVVSVR